MPPDMQYRNREKQNDQEHHKKFSLSWLSFRKVFFLFEKMSSSLPMLLVMLFVHVGKLSNNRLQMFFKADLFTNFGIFTGKHLCWCVFVNRNAGRFTIFTKNTCVGISF